MDLAKSGRNLNGCQILISEGEEKRAGIVGLCNLDFFRSENTASTRKCDHVGHAGGRQAGGGDLPFWRNTRGDICKFAVTYNFPFKPSHVGC